MATSANRDPPTTVAYCIATAILAALGGYFLGQASSLGLLGDDAPKRKRQETDISEPTNTKTVQEDPAKEVQAELENESDDSENDQDPDEADQQQDLLGFEDTGNEECKLVLVVRTDLGMTKGTDLLAYYAIIFEWTNTTRRQDCSAMLPRDPRLLQSAILPFQIESLRTLPPSTVGALWTGESGGAGQERGGAGDTAGDGDESGAVCESNT